MCGSVILFVVVSSVSASAQSAEERGQSLAKQLYQKQAGYKDLVGDVEMILTDSGGNEAKRNFRLKVLERPSAQEADRSLIVFDAPADVKGTAVLSHGSAEGNDEQWLFVPSAKRTRRISSSNRTGAFVGSEFSFEDLTGSDGRKYEWKWLGEKACGTVQCIELESKPKGGESAYSRRVIRATHDELKVEEIAFYDRKGALLKTLVYDEFKTLNDRFLRAHRWTMSNVQTGKRTTLRFASMKLSTGLSATDFAPGKLGN